MARYERIPTVIEAVQWTGDNDAELVALGAPFMVERLVGDPPWPLSLLAGKGGAQGPVGVPVGHWVAKGAPDDFWPIDPEVFSATYRPVPDLVVG